MASPAVFHLTLHFDRLPGQFCRLLERLAGHYIELWWVLRRWGFGVESKAADPETGQPAQMKRNNEMQLKAAVPLGRPMLKQSVNKALALNPKTRSPKTGPPATRLPS